MNVCKYAALTCVLGIVSLALHPQQVAHGSAGNDRCCQEDWEPPTVANGNANGMQVCVACAGFNVYNCVDAPAEYFFCDQQMKPFSQVCSILRRTRQLWRRQSLGGIYRGELPNP